MKNTLIIVALSLYISTAAQATLIQGDFSGFVDVNGSTTTIVDGASFEGNFLYDNETLELFGLSATLFGLDEIYIYDSGANLSVIGETYGDPNILDFHGLPTWGKSIDGENLTLNPQLSLNFDGNGNFIPGGSNSGSVLYFWTTTQFNCNITLMTTSPYASPVPEPATMLLFGSGIAGLVASKRRKRKNNLF